MSRKKVVRGASWENYCSMMIASGIRSAICAYNKEDLTTAIVGFRIISEEPHEQEGKESEGVEKGKSF